MRLHARSQATSGGEQKPCKQGENYCTNVQLRIIEILITLMYKLSAVTLMLLPSPSANIRQYVRTGQVK